jgi:hypothetical protein
MFATPRILLIATAILEGIGGLLAILAPPLFVEMTFPGVASSDAALFIARAFGIALIALAVLAFFSRNFTGAAVKPTLAALLTYNVVVAVHFGSLVLSQQAGIGAPVMHLLLSVGYGYYWHKSR